MKNGSDEGNVSVTNINVLECSAFSFIDKEKNISIIFRKTLLRKNVLFSNLFL